MPLCRPSTRSHAESALSCSTRTRCSSRSDSIELGDACVLGLERLLLLLGDRALPRHLCEQVGALAFELREAGEHRGAAGAGVLGGPRGERLDVGGGEEEAAVALAAGARGGDELGGDLGADPTRGHAEVLGGLLDADGVLCLLPSPSSPRRRSPRSNQSDGLIVARLAVDGGAECRRGRITSSRGLQSPHAALVGDDTERRTTQHGACRGHAGQGHQGRPLHRERPRPDVGRGDR